MTQEEIKALAEMQSKINEYDKIVNKLVEARASENVNYGISIYIAGSQIFPRIVPPALFDKVAELIHNEYTTELIKLMEFKDNLVLCKENKKTNYKPVTIIPVKLG